VESTRILYAADIIPLAYLAGYCSLIGMCQKMIKRSARQWRSAMSIVFHCTLM
jgi:hypothetical protein